VASARGLYRLGLIVAGLGAAALILAGWVSLGAVNLSPPPLGVLIAACERFLSPDVSPRALFTLSLATPGLAAIALGSRSLLRELRAQRRLAARLEVTGKVDVDGSEVLVLDDHRARAFCAGYLRPRIYVSSGALALLSRSELGAVVAHERHHRARRDPLRLLAFRTLSESLFFLPVLRRLADRYRVLAEMAADEAAAREWGRRKLASACSPSARARHRKRPSASRLSASTTCSGSRHAGSSPSPCWLGPFSPPSLSERRRSRPVGRSARRR